MAPVSRLAYRLLPASRPRSPAWGEKVVRPERFELPAFWFVAEFHPLHPTTPANQTQQNNRRRCYGFCPVLAGFGSSSRTENGQTRMARKNARCKTGVFQLAESAKIQHGRLSCWRLLRGTAYRREAIRDWLLSQEQQRNGKNARPGRGSKDVCLGLRRQSYSASQRNRVHLRADSPGVVVVLSATEAALKRIALDDDPRAVTLKFQHVLSAPNFDHLSLTRANLTFN